MSIFWEVGSYCLRFTQEETEPPKNSSCSRLHSGSDQPEIWNQVHLDFAFFHCHKQSAWEDLGRPELQGRVSVECPCYSSNFQAELGSFRNEHWNSCIFLCQWLAVLPTAAIKIHTGLRESRWSRGKMPGPQGYWAGGKWGPGTRA